MRVLFAVWAGYCLPIQLKNIILSFYNKRLIGWPVACSIWGRQEIYGFLNERASHTLTDWNALRH